MKCERFVEDTRNQTAEQIQRLANVTQNVVDHQKDLEQILHVAPTADREHANMFDPRDGGATGIFTLSNFSNPVQFICGAIGAIENVTAPETAKLCAQYLGPALKLMNVNYIPLPINPILSPVPGPARISSTPIPLSRLAAAGYQARPKRRPPYRHSPEQETCHRRRDTGQPAPPPAGPTRLPGIDAAAGRGATSPTPPSATAR